jgi:regulator of CtrA degradation
VREPPSGAPAQAAPTAFFDKTYDEAMGLLEQARGYLSVLEPIDRRQLGAVERLKLCTETMRMTARLTQIMAWLLAERAIFAGELSREAAIEGQEGLAALEICMDRGEADWMGLPGRLVTLLDRSHRLYVRVARLDDLARRRLQ